MGTLRGINKAAWGPRLMLWFRATVTVQLLQGIHDFSKNERAKFVRCYRASVYNRGFKFKVKKLITVVTVVKGQRNETL